MKPNEAPEKLYCVATEGGYYLTAIKSEPPFTEAVEYTRTDVFIDKACKWLEKNIAEATGIDSYTITESFKQAMEE